jgi:hypothetical protein
VRPKPYTLFFIGAFFTFAVLVLLILFLLPPEAISVPL